MTCFFPILLSLHLSCGRVVLITTPTTPTPQAAPEPQENSRCQIWPGRSCPLGTTYDSLGTNLALYSSTATSVDLCLSDDEGHEERVAFKEVDGDVWHAYLPGTFPGRKYGYRMASPYDLASGHRCDPSKLLLDPYARAISGEMTPSQTLYFYSFDNLEVRNEKNSTDHTMCSVVINPCFGWGHDRPPNHEYHETIIYEAHVEDMTKLHSMVPEDLRSTYADLAQPAVIDHLKNLGAAATEFMPVHQFVNDTHPQERGLSDYWDYNTIGFSAPYNTYAACSVEGERVQEFKSMVRASHETDIEVILDAVYNHMAKGNHLGPTLSFRGISNSSYYRFVDGSASHHPDITGTGNSLLIRSPAVLQFIMDSLRHWAIEMHVGGFRFDLASTLTRQFHGVDKLGAFFDITHRGPMLSQVRFVAKPWGVDDGGYNVGGFLALWGEWNGRYHDIVRNFWRGELSTLGELTSRITSSSDLYQHAGRIPVTSINFVTTYDGLTLRGLVSYNEKHNEANLEGNADGNNNNRPWNCGAERPIDDPMTTEPRQRQTHNSLVAVLFSQGVPMICHGDKMGRAQGGNSNVYRQDNETSQVNWDLSEQNNNPLRFTRTMMWLRRGRPVLRRRRFLTGGTRHGGEGELGKIEWLTPVSESMTDQDWII